MIPISEAFHRLHVLSQSEGCWAASFNVSGAQHLGCWLASSVLFPPKLTDFGPIEVQFKLCILGFIRLDYTYTNRLLHLDFSHLVFNMVFLQSSRVADVTVEPEPWVIPTSNRSYKTCCPLSQKTSASINKTCLSSILEVDVSSIVTITRGTADKDEPLLVVACGRDTISIASSIKRLTSENVFVVQIQHPRRQVSRFDLVFAPQHDYYALTPHAQEYVPEFLRKYMTPDEPPSKNVVDGVLDTYGSVRISFSRRTPVKIATYVRKELVEFLKIYIWDNKEPNPHMGHLAWADAFIVTADSVSMLSEACSTGDSVS
ncbi:unnamed protein product [Lactuca saligna]|uniref:Uncharacterized protein n=1 Tax=Lactuca saligna TaxID=75948 RepID=A0AA36DX07_LACSI|nr:unnamed protein product [Lactuca saligna]